MYGYTGKILRVNLTTQITSTINTEDYKDWVGGHGIATAIFFDLVKDKTVSAFDPANTLVIMSSLFSGTLIPASCRTEMVGIQAQSYPKEWFTRSNAGGRFASMLKYAGYDGIVLEGAAKKPTWINIVDGKAELKDATGLWGMDTFQTQNTIYKEVTGSRGFGDWLAIGGNSTTQRPSVICIGPAGENKSRIGTVMTDTGNSFGQGGFGGVWGAKNLKAISAWGTGGVEVADPKAVMEARLWAQKNYASNYDNLQIRQWMAPITSHFCGVRYNAASWDAQKGISGCEGCHLNCQTRTSTGLGNDSVCMDANTFGSWDQTKHGKRTEITGIGVDLLQRMGINTFEFNGVTLPYVKSLYDKGLMGAGKNINSRLNFDRIGEVDFIEEMIRDIAYRLDIGNDLAEGAPRAAQRWGRVEEDLYTGLLNEQYYGYPNHYDARTEVYWGYATIVAGRDVNAHDFNVCSYRVAESGSPALVPAQQIADIFAKLPPYFDADMMDFSTNNIYSIHMARTTAWLMHYSTFWKQTCGLCDNAYADWVNPYGPGNRGLTPEAEPKFYKAVTGKSLSFEESMEQGRKQFNMDKAILTLQGRHRDMEIFPEFTYIVDRTGNYWMTWKENNVWAYKNTTPRHLEKTGVEEWKTNFYQLEGWDTKTGWQTRAMLESLGLKKVADELASKGKLPV